MQAAENPEVAEAVKKAYSGMGNTLYFDIAKGTHAVLYELPEERLNWLWYACNAVLRHALHALLAASCYVSNEFVRDLCIIMSTLLAFLSCCGIVRQRSVSCCAASCFDASCCAASCCLMLCCVAPCRALLPWLAQRAQYAATYLLHAALCMAQTSGCRSA